MKGLEKLLDKKKKGKDMPMSDIEKSAKMGVLQDLHGKASNLLAEKLKGLKKVTVVSDSPEGLKKGLEKAEEIVEGSEEGELSCPEAEMAGMDIEEKIAMLEQELMKLKAMKEEKEESEE